MEEEASSCATGREMKSERRTIVYKFDRWNSSSLAVSALFHLSTSLQRQTPVYNLIRMSDKKTNIRRNPFEDYRHHVRFLLDHKFAALV